MGNMGQGRAVRSSPLVEFTVDPRLLERGDWFQNGLKERMKSFGFHRIRLSKNATRSFHFALDF